MAKLTASAVGLLAAYGLCRVLPLAWVSAFGAWRGRYRAAQLKELEDRARLNLAEIAPSANPEEILPRLRAESGRALMEVLVADRLARSGHLSFKPNQELQDMARQNRSIVFALIHQCNLGDVCGAAVGQAFAHVRHLYVVTRHIQNPVMRWMVQRTRHKSMRGISGLISGPAPGLARQMIEGLSERPPSIVLMHVDEARAHQVAFPQFGRAATDPDSGPDSGPNNSRGTGKGNNASYAVRMARRTAACLVPVAITRNPLSPTRFELRALSVWDLATDDRTNQAVLHDMSALFEAEILKDPAQWLNLYHRRPSANNTILEDPI